MRNIEEILVVEEVYAENTIGRKPEKGKITMISQQKTNTIVYLQIEEKEVLRLLLLTSLTLAVKLCAKNIEQLGIQLFAEGEL